MKIIKIDLPESYLKLLEKAVSKNVCSCLNIPEYVRLQVREELRQELIAGKKKNKLNISILQLLNRLDLSFRIVEQLILERLN